MLLFLSYAHQDSEIGSEISALLHEHNVQTYRSQNGVRRHALLSSDVETAISQADGFLVLASAHSLASHSCRQKRELALRRQQTVSMHAPEHRFIQVLKIRETPSLQTALLHGVPWLHMTTDHAKEIALSHLAETFTTQDTRMTSAASSETTGALPTFRNRDEELDAVLDGLNSESGQHFWLVIAPPQLGKTWFLQRISQKIEESDRWIVHPVDARKQPAEVRNDPQEFLRVLFDARYSSASAPENIQQQAVDLKGTNKSHLYVLDSAELLSGNTVREVRRYLSQVYRHVQDRRNRNVRIAMIVASRRDRDWRGVTPKPRLKALTLSKFELAVVYDALEELATFMEQDIDATELRRDAELVHRVSEGLPALLYQYLEWIQDQQWTGLPRLEEKEQFDKLTGPYIEKDLLAPKSLFRSDIVPTSDERIAMERALKVLVPFRLLTQSHLRHHVGPEGSLNTINVNLRWTAEEYWDNVSSTDLLIRPALEPWDEIYAPLRRLLCRHWYPSDSDLAHAHRDARRFIQSWLSGQLGSEQAVILVECIWHELQFLLLSRSANIETALTTLATTLSADLVESSIHSRGDIRQYAVDRMRDDAELAEAAEVIDGLLGRIIDAVLSDTEGPGK